MQPLLGPKRSSLIYSKRLATVTSVYKFLEVLSSGTFFLSTLHVRCHSSILSDGGGFVEKVRCTGKPLSTGPTLARSVISHEVWICHSVPPLGVLQTELVPVSPP